MVQSASTLPQTHVATELVTYEQPLTEKMRTFLRLEFLFRQAAHHSSGKTTWETRAAVTSLLEILAILGRGDVRTDALKELERYAGDLEQFRSRPGVDNARLAALLSSVQALRDSLAGFGKQLGHNLRDSSFLNSVKHRSAIPGGTCEFDLPDYRHWLSRPWESRQRDFDDWMETLAPLREAVNKLLWLKRESAESAREVAKGGMFQHMLKKNLGCQLLRVALPEDSDVFPEISGSQHRFTIRFLRWSSVETRPAQTTEDVVFQLACC